MHFRAVRKVHSRNRVQRKCEMRLTSPKVTRNHGCLAGQVHGDGRGRGEGEHYFRWPSAHLK